MSEAAVLHAEAEPQASPLTPESWGKLGMWLFIAGDATSFGVRSLRAGVRGAPSPEPLLELLQVRIDGAVHPLLDLSTPNALADSAKTIVRDALRAAVGSSPAASHLLALAGIVPPAADPSWPHDLDLATFVADPMRAVASVHRRALLDPVHPWSALFNVFPSTNPTPEATTNAQPAR